jgi:dTMP kinase
MKGKLIVFEGIDASGKTTQAKLLLKALKKKGFSVQYFSSPTKKTFFGKLLHDFLHAKLKQKLSPEQLALLFVLDRAQLKERILQGLEQGTVFVLDRYKASTLAYQTAFFPVQEQEAFLFWAKQLEQRMPDADLTLFLDVNPDQAKQLLKNKKKDILEKNFSFQKEVYKIYLQLQQSQKFTIIGCAENNKLLTKKAIAEKVWKEVENVL